MASDRSIQAAVQAINGMTEKELTAWLAAGDYTTVGGVSLPERVSRKISELLSTSEVEGFAMNAGMSAGALPRPESVSGRKAGKDQLEFIKIELRDILISG